MDLQFGFTDITTALCADRVLFNSRFHFDHFFKTLPGFIAQMPEFKPGWVVDAIRNKAGILHPGCRFTDDWIEPAPLPVGPPIIIWNHRWEFDKQPDTFFDALDQVERMGIDFRLALMGENYQAAPRAFEYAKRRFADKIVQYGYVRSKDAYVNWLKKGYLAVSTAIQENFGIAMIEAMRFGCLPLLPHRLAYPEVLPKGSFMPIFYTRMMRNLVQKLATLLRDPQQFVCHRPVLAGMMARHAWSDVAVCYDRELALLAKAR